MSIPFSLSCGRNGRLRTSHRLLQSRWAIWMETSLRNQVCLAAYLKAYFGQSRWIGCLWHGKSALGFIINATGLIWGESYSACLLSVLVGILRCNLDSTLRLLIELNADSLLHWLQNQRPPVDDREHVKGSLQWALSILILIIASWPVH